MYRVYWTEGDKPTQPCMANFSELTEALNYTQKLRSCGYDFVTMCSENPNCTSLPGVDSVKGMILPNGAEYGYVKRRYK